MSDELDPTKPISLTNHFTKRWFERVMCAKSIPNASENANLITHVRDAIRKKTHSLAYDGEVWNGTKHRLVFRLGNEFLTLRVVDADKLILLSVWKSKKWEELLWRREHEVSNMQR